MRSSLWQPLGLSDFRRLWLAESVSIFGDQFFLVALPWLVLQISGSGAAVGSVLMCAAFPRALLMLVGGAFSDRFPPRAIMIISNVARGAFVSALALIVAANGMGLSGLYLFGLAFGIVDAFFFPAFSAIVPSLVLTDQLAAAHGVLQGTARLAMLIGPAAAGVLVARAGVVPAFLVNAASFAFAAVLIAAIRGARGGRGQPAESPPSEARPVATISAITEGLVYAWHDRLTRAFLLVLAVMNFAFIGPFIVGLATMADRRLGGPTAFGAALSALGGGALLGSVLTGAAGLKRRRGAVWLTICFVLGAGLVPIGMISSFPLLLTLIAVLGTGSAFLNVVMVALLQQRTPAHLIGRVMSLVMLAAVGLSPLSYVLAGLLVDVSPALMFAAAGTLVVAVTAVASADAEVRAIQ